MGSTPAARLAGLATMRKNVLEGKGEELTALITALFEDANQTHFRGDKALKFTVNFENYFIYALNSVSNANIAHVISI